MDTQAPDIVSVPEIDTPYYFGNFLGGISDFFTEHGWDLWGFAQDIVGFIVGFSIPVALFFLISIIITVEGLKRVRAIEEERYLTPPKAEPQHEKVDKELAKRWRTALEHADSENPNDWKQAIIEADIMLDQLLIKLGYQGESVGDRLKRATRGDFKTLDHAWEAHKVRNRIAHDGSDFDLNQLEAKRVMGLYRLVFDEFYHISEK